MTKQMGMEYGCETRESAQSKHVQAPDRGSWAPAAAPQEPMLCARHKGGLSPGNTREPPTDSGGSLGSRECKPPGTMVIPTDS